MQRYFPLPAHGSTTTQCLGAILAVVIVVSLIWWLHPVLDRHEGTAAWVQAAGAILIIGATAWTAGRNSREAEQRERNAQRQLRQSIAALARSCLDAFDTLITDYPLHQFPAQGGKFLRSYAQSDVDIPIDGLAAVPLHQVGDANLITAVLTLRGIMGRTKKILDDAQSDPASTLKTVQGQRTPMFNAVASVLRIVEGHAADQELSRLAGRV